MSFAPGSTRLIGSVVKVEGTMSAKSVSVSGTTALAITVNYVFTYAIEPPGSRPTGCGFSRTSTAASNSRGGTIWATGSSRWISTIIGHAGG